MNVCIHHNQNLHLFELHQKTIHDHSASNCEENSPDGLHILPISSGARQHLVDAVDVEGVGTDTNMEGVLAAVLHQILKHDRT